MNDHDLKKIDEMFKHHVGILTKKIDSVEGKLTNKIDAIAADLKAHRADTEAHTKIYKVKET